MKLQPNHTETIALLVAAACFGAKVLAGTALWGWGLGIGLFVALSSYVLRQGWKPSL